MHLSENRTCRLMPLLQFFWGRPTLGTLRTQKRVLCHIIFNYVNYYIAQMCQMQTIAIDDLVAWAPVILFVCPSVLTHSLDGATSIQPLPTLLCPLVWSQFSSLYISLDMIARSQDCWSQCFLFLAHVNTAILQNWIPYIKCATTGLTPVLNAHSIITQMNVLFN